MLGRLLLADRLPPDCVGPLIPSDLERFMRLGDSNLKREPDGVETNEAHCTRSESAVNREHAISACPSRKK